MNLKLEIEKKNHKIEEGERKEESFLLERVHQWLKELLVAICGIKMPTSHSPSSLY